MTQELIVGFILPLIALVLAVVYKNKINDWWATSGIAMVKRIGFILLLLFIILFFIALIVIGWYSDHVRLIYKMN